jgi:hypothetical protein
MRQRRVGGRLLRDLRRVDRLAVQLWTNGTVIRAVCLYIAAAPENVLICRRASAFSMVQVASAATCVPTRLVSRGVCRVTAVGRLAETAVGGPQRAGDMYQKSSGTPLAH